jgi:2-C-methyl-D-erythritol 4-phosphate cytidylyltransferase
MIDELGLIIVAAGSSNRMKGIDKVWAPLGDHSVVYHCLHALAPIAKHTVVVVREGQRARAGQEFAPLDRAPAVVTGGTRRQESVARGLAALPPVRIVAVHDAARPFAEPAILFRGAELVQQCDGAIPGLPVTDTMKQVDQRAQVVATVDRSPLRSVQTPQVFRRDALVAAHTSAYASGSEATDDAALLEACNFKVFVFPGDPGNFKITTEHDLRVARLLLADVPTR